MSPASYMTIFYNLNVIKPQSYWERTTIYTAFHRAFNKVESCYLYDWLSTIAT